VKIVICTEPFDAYGEIARYESGMGVRGGSGATAVFIGTMRDFNEGRKVDRMHLEYYPGMTEKHLERICAEAGSRWNIIDCLVVHRVGGIAVGEPIVAVGVWSVHRGDALDACRYIIEDLKSRAPFWKNEESDSGNRWVEKNTCGYAGEKR
jgi:molybdopterin synthase catalytic subunit